MNCMVVSKFYATSKSNYLWTSSSELLGCESHNAWGSGLPRPISVAKLCPAASAPLLDFEVGPLAQGLAHLLPYGISSHYGFLELCL